MPCTFSPGDRDDLSNIKLENINVTLDDGSMGVVSFASYVPAIEANERLTLLLLGDFGYRHGKDPVKVMIEGASYEGYGLKYKDTGESLMFATFWNATAHKDLEGPGKINKN